VTSVVAFLFRQEGCNPRQTPRWKRLSDAVQPPIRCSEMMRGRICPHIRSVIAIARGSRLAVAARARGRAHRQFLQLVELHGAGGARRLHQGNRIKVVYDTFETPTRPWRHGCSRENQVTTMSSFPPPISLANGRYTANVFQKLDKSKLPNLANAWPVVTKTARGLRSRQHLRRQLYVGTT